jgi:flagellar hook-associated protein 1
MTSTFMGLELGKRGLFAQQAALYTTGQNIANANTAGYTRQRAEMQATSAIPAPGMNNDVSAGQLGTGVEVNKVARLREDFLDVQYRGENSNLGYYEAKTDTYTKMEGLMNEPSDNGLAHAMDQFWSSWEDLTKNPESSAARATVRENGQAVAESFQFLNDSFNQMETDLNTVITTDVNNINSITGQISDLNNQISRITANNEQPNDLFDKRDVLLDQLSKLVNVDVKPSNNGMVDVFVSGTTQALVQGNTTNTLSVTQSGGGINQILIGNNPVSLDQLTGELSGRIESYGYLNSNGTLSGTIPDMKQKVDALAATFADQVNQVHSQGMNIDDITNRQTNPSAPLDALPFFVDKDWLAANQSSYVLSGNQYQTVNDSSSAVKPQNAGNLVVNPLFFESLNKIAAALPESGGQSSTGNGQNAQAIANLKFNSVTINGSTSTMDDYYQNVIAQLGIDSQDAQRMQDNSQVMVNQVDNQRQSVSGVSLDEEMSNMIRFQQAYNASARLVTTMDEVLDKVINGMGRVGL